MLCTRRGCPTRNRPLSNPGTLVMSEGRTGRRSTTATSMQSCISARRGNCSHASSRPQGMCESSPENIFRWAGNLRASRLRRSADGAGSRDGRAHRVEAGRGTRRASDNDPPVEEGASRGGARQAGLPRGQSCRLPTRTGLPTCAMHGRGSLPGAKISAPRLNPTGSAHGSITNGRQRTKTRTEKTHEHRLEGTKSRGISARI